MSLERVARGLFWLGVMLFVVAVACLGLAQLGGWECPGGGAHCTQTGVWGVVDDAGALLLDGAVTVLILAGILGLCAIGARAFAAAHHRRTRSS